MSQRDLGSSEDSERNLRSSVDSERDLVVADVGEGPQIECGLGARPEAFFLYPQWASWYVDFVVRLRRFCCSRARVTISMRVKIWPLQILSTNSDYKLFNLFWLLSWRSFKALIFVFRYLSLVSPWLLVSRTFERLQIPEMIRSIRLFRILSLSFCSEVWNRCFTPVCWQWQRILNWLSNLCNVSLLI